MNRNLKNVVKEGVFLSRIKNDFKSKYDEGENYEIKQQKIFWLKVKTI